MNKYMTVQWAEAKNELVAAVRTAIAAADMAENHIRQCCGQILDAHEVSQKGIEFRVQDTSLYDRKAVLAGIWPVPDSAKHWSTSLREVRQETADLRKWNTPEVWEAAWAESQKI